MKKKYKVAESYLQKLEDIKKYSSGFINEKGERKMKKSNHEQTSYKIVTVDREMEL